MGDVLIPKLTCFAYALLQCILKVVSDAGESAPPSLAKFIKDALLTYNVSEFKRFCYVNSITIEPSGGEVWNRAQNLHSVAGWDKPENTELVLKNYNEARDLWDCPFPVFTSECCIALRPFNTVDCDRNNARMLSDFILGTILTKTFKTSEKEMLIQIGIEETKFFRELGSERFACYVAIPSITGRNKSRPHGKVKFRGFEFHFSNDYTTLGVKVSQTFEENLDYSEKELVLDEPEETLEYDGPELC